MYLNLLKNKKSNKFEDLIDFIEQLLNQAAPHLINRSVFLGRNEAGHESCWQRTDCGKASLLCWGGLCQMTSLGRTEHARLRSWSG